MSKMYYASLNYSTVNPINGDELNGPMAIVEVRHVNHGPLEGSRTFYGSYNQAVEWAAERFWENTFPLNSWVSNNGKTHEDIHRAVEKLRRDYDAAVDQMVDAEIERMMEQYDMSEFEWLMEVEE